MFIDTKMPNSILFVICPWWIFFSNMVHFSLLLRLLMSRRTRRTMKVWLSLKTFKKFTKKTGSKASNQLSRTWIRLHLLPLSSFQLFKITRMALQNVDYHHQTHNLTKSCEGRRSLGTSRGLRWGEVQALEVLASSLSMLFNTLPHVYSRNPLWVFQKHIL